MPQKHVYTLDEKTELLSNPYTIRVTNCKVVFSLAFKQFVLETSSKPGMTSAKVFQLAGYRKELFSVATMQHAVKAIRKEAASPEGLREEPEVKQHIPKKKHSETEFKELQERVLLLEQKVEFLKKSQFLKGRNHSQKQNSSN